MKKQDKEKRQIPGARNPGTTGAAAMKPSIVTYTVEQVDHIATGQIFREARVVSKISLREMARRLRLSAAYVSDLELGRRNWTQDKADRFNSALLRGPLP